MKDLRIRPQKRVRYAMENCVAMHAAILEVL